MNRPFILATSMDSHQGAFGTLVINTMVKHTRLIACRGIIQVKGRTVDNLADFEASDEVLKASGRDRSALEPP